MARHQSRKSIAFVINSIGYGGAERVLQNILASIGAHRSTYDIHLIILDTEPERRDMPDYVRKHVLDSRSSLTRSTRLLTGCLHRLKPSLVVSFLVRANVASAIAGKLLGLPVIVCERMHLSSHLEGRYTGLRLKMARAAPKLSYRFASHVLGVSTGVTDDLVENFSVPRAKARTIFNPFDIPAINLEASRDPEIALPDRFAVAIGRLTASKNFLQLVDAFIQAHQDLSLLILGEGPERAALESRIRYYGAEKRILLPGYIRNPFAIVARAVFYVSSSLNEGFPNAMVEAMALGIPIVASNCRSGPAEILGGALKENEQIVDAAFGILVQENSAKALLAGMIRMADPAVRNRYASQARERARHFDIHRISQHYWSLFDEVSNEA